MTDESQPPVEDYQEPAQSEYIRPHRPKEITAAICEIMGGIKSLEKDAKNEYGKYKYASIEGFLEMLRPLQAKAGLVIDMIEDEVSFRAGSDSGGKSTSWLVIQYSFMLSHKDGATWDYYPTRTGIANANMGSQAFGACQSYALKQYTRSLFMISTGEEAEPDIDRNKPEDLPAQTAAREPRVDQDQPSEPDYDARGHPAETDYEDQGQPDPEPAAKKPDSTLPPAYQLDPSAFLSGTNLELPVIETKNGKKYWKRWQVRMIELVHAATDLDTLRALEGDNTQIIVLLGAAHAPYFAAVSEAFAKQRKTFEDLNGGQANV